MRQITRLAASALECENYLVGYSIGVQSVSSFYEEHCKNNFNNYAMCVHYLIGFTCSLHDWKMGCCEQDYVMFPMLPMLKLVKYHIPI